MKDECPLGRYASEWKTHAEEVDPFLKPALGQNELENPRLQFLYEDCYYVLLIGRYNASIVLMGVLLEALMKERIWLKLGIEFSKPYQACLKLIEKDRLMRKEDIDFLEDFRKNVRNLYQHSEQTKILDGIFIPTWSIKLDRNNMLESLRKGKQEIAERKSTPVLIPASHPAIAPVVKQSYDRNHAIYLFNQVYDFFAFIKNQILQKREIRRSPEKIWGQVISLINS